MVPIPEIKPEFFGAAVCGLTASIGLDKAGRLKQGEKVLITAAAGGVGMCSLFVNRSSKWPNNAIQDILRFNGRREGVLT